MGIWVLLWDVSQPLWYQNMLLTCKDTGRYKIWESQRRDRWCLLLRALQKEGVSLLCRCLFSLFYFWKFPPSGVVLNYSNTVDCAAVICQEPKSTSIFLSVSNLVKLAEEEEEGKLRHQRWHCEYLMVFMGTASDHSQRHCSPRHSQNTSLAGKRVARVWLKFKQENMFPWKCFIESTRASC